MIFISYLNERSDFVSTSLSSSIRETRQLETQERLSLRAFCVDHRTPLNNTKGTAETRLAPTSQKPPSRVGPNTHSLSPSFLNDYFMCFFLVEGMSLPMTQTGPDGLWRSSLVIFCPRSPLPCDRREICLGHNWLFKAATSGVIAKLSVHLGSFSRFINDFV